ncbi:histidine phosphatase family protein [Antarcticimicrobium luteum]|uniref:Histidine phosphatase family protein n=1 Tax=Antarcticimicrobium luteum TaxID=2547397 RepID=A0A4R5V371_9RHOB|nr:histidine phosphatase family protein [Antarcticimicrobium luteum]TDK46279.1 histidine phosphatase family protein [Antarcticimicrobium luteum]
MSHITLIRHGQANSGARDEISYDRLSPLGHQQAQWLGEHLRASAPDHRQIHGRIYCGTLTRHVETAQAMGLGAALRDPRLNELEYFTLARLMEQQRGLVIPQDREGFVAHLPKVFDAWQRGEIDAPPESFEAFETRVREALADIAAGPGPALVVTSGGLIAMAMRQVLGLGIPSMARMALAIMNTSLHRLFPIGDSLSPTLFNAVPHLETPERHYAQTHL